MSEIRISYEEEEEILSPNDEVVFDEVEETPAKKNNLWDQVIFYLLAALIFLLPVFVLLSPGIAVDFGKTMLVYGVSLSVIVLYCIARFKDGWVSYLKSPLFLASIAILLSSFLSSLFSGFFSKSFLGDGTEMWTTLFTFSALSLMFFVAIFFRSRSRVLTGLALLGGSAVFVFLFQLTHLFFDGKFTSFQYFIHPLHNMLGRWSDLGIFAGLIFVLSLVTLEMLRMEKKLRVALIALAALAFFFVVVAKFSGGAIIIFLFTLFVFSYSFFTKERKILPDGTERRQLPILPLIFIVLSILMMVEGDRVSQALSKTFQIPFVQEVRPSLQGTIEVVRGMFVESPMRIPLGVGPNRFFTEWLKNRPAEVNLSPWWNVDFNAGVGIIPSTLVTLGVVGFLAWMFFLAVFLSLGIRAVRREWRGEDRLRRFLVFGTFLGAAYLWIMAVVAVPSVVLYTFAFIFTGLFLAVLSEGGHMLQIKDIPFFRDPRAGFTVVVFLILFMIIGVVSGFLLYKKYGSAFLYRDGLVALQNRDYATAEEKFSRAVKLSKNDIYYRSFTDLNILRLGELLSKTDIEPDSLRLQFENMLSLALRSSEEAIRIDDQNYMNWFTRGGAFAYLVPIKIQNLSDDAYVNAKAALDKAVTLNPKNPAIVLAKARMELMRGNEEEARVLIQQSLDLKNNYTEAIFLLSQMDYDRGSLDDAIITTEKGVAFESSNIGLLFQLGFLRYRAGDYEGSISALERSIAIYPYYSNAKYFLGLAYDKVGREEDAIKQFEEVRLLNPENTEVPSILENLRAGRSAFVESSSIPAPEERTTPPIQE